MLTRLQEKDFEQIFEIMEKGFPPSERRSKEKQRGLLTTEEYNVFGLKEDDDLLGFIAEWNGPEYRFIEHLAVNEEFQGKGIGSKLLTEYHRLSDKPVILEVEPPENEIQKRRVKFYERNSYHLTEHGYVQPSINENIKGVPLVLMSYPDRLTNPQFLSVKEWLFRTVYDLEKND